MKPSDSALEYGSPLDVGSGALLGPLHRVERFSMELYITKPESDCSASLAPGVHGRTWSYKMRGQKRSTEASFLLVT